MAHFPYTTFLQSRISVLNKNTKIIMHIWICIYLYVCVFMCIQVYVYKQVYILYIYTHTHIYMCKVYIYLVRSETKFRWILVPVLLSSNRQVGWSLTDTMEKFTLVEEMGLHTQMLVVVFKRKIFLHLEELSCSVCGVKHNLMWGKFWKLISTLNDSKQKCFMFRCSC